LIDEKHAKTHSAKLDTLFEMLEELRESGHKALVFSQFTGFLALRLPLRPLPGQPCQFRGALRPLLLDPGQLAARAGNRALGGLEVPVDPVLLDRVALHLLPDPLDARIHGLKVGFGACLAVLGGDARKRRQHQAGRKQDE
jgi:hypothetical protein